MNMRHALAVASLSAGLVTAIPAAVDAATVYDGNSVTFQYYAYGGVYGGGGSPATFTAPGSTPFFNFFDVKVSGNRIIYKYLSDTTWSASTTSLNSGGLYVDNGSVIYSAGGEPAITSVTLDPSSTLGPSGFNSSDITFNSGAVAVTWMNLSFEKGDKVILDINGGGGGVPEPATWAIMLVGFAGVGAALRLRGKRAVVSA